MVSLLAKHRLRLYAYVLSVLFLFLANSAHAEVDLKHQDWSILWEDKVSRSGVAEVLNVAENKWIKISNLENISGRIGNTLWMKTTLPEGDYNALYINTLSQIFEVYVDGQRIYQFGNLPPHGDGKYLGNPFHLVDLNSGGKILMLRVYSRIGSIGPRGRFLLGDKSDLLLKVVRYDQDRIILSGVFIVLGLLGFILYFSRGSETLHIGFGIFSVSVGMLILSATRMKQLFLDTPELWAYINLTGIMTSTAAFAYFMETIFGLGRFRALRRIWQANLLLCAIGLASSLIGYTEYIEFQQIYHLAVILTSIVFLFYLVWNALQGVREARIIIGGFVVLAAFTVHDILNEQGIIRFTKPLLQWGMFVFLGFLAYIVRLRYWETFGRLRTVSAEMNIASKIQTSLLPEKVPNLKKIKIAVLYRPAASVGGDIYEFIEDRDGLGIFIGDISGHGLAPALLASMVKMAMQYQKPYFDSPARLLDNLNNALYGNFKKDYMTSIYLHIDPETLALTYSTAGHPPGLLLRRDNDDIIELETKGRAIGVFREIEFEDKYIQLKGGDRLLLYTDGVTECRNKELTLVGQGNLEAFMRENRDKEKSHFLQVLNRYLKEWRENASVQDDITALVIEIVD